MEGSGKEVRSPSPPPLRTARAPFRRMQLKHWATHLSRHAVACIGLEGNLHDTTPGPAAEMPSVAAGAPAGAFTTPPTVLLPCPRRLADGPRAPTPEGSRPAFAWGDVATPIRPITGRPSLAPSSSTRSPVGWPYGLPTPRGRVRAYHVAPLKPRGLGPASTPVARQLRGPSSERPNLATYRLVQA
jgi:hypothetical protein